MPVLTQTQTQTVAGEGFTFDFTGIDNPSFGDVMITVRMIEMDLSVPTPGENYVITPEAGPALGPITYNDATGEQILVADNTTFDYSYLMTGADFLSAVNADDTLTIKIELSAAVAPIGATNDVQVTVAYAEDQALVGATKLTGAEVLVFDDATYVDTIGTASSESDTIQASLTSLSHNVSTLTTDDSNDLGAALKGKDVFVMPELEVSAFAPSADFIAELQAFTTQGGTVIVAGGRGTGRNADFMNDVFGFSVVEDSSSATPPIDNVHAPLKNHITTFDDDPATITDNLATNGMVVLPVGADVIYEDANGDAVVWGAGYGLGQVIALGWDWFSAAPLSSQDGGWLQVLDSAVSTTADDIPADITTAETLVDNGPAVVHNLNTRDDVDWFALEALCGVEYTIAAGDFGGGPDPYLELRDETGAFIAFDNDGGPGDDAELTFTASYSGTYYIASGNSPFISAFVSNGGIELTATSDLVRLTNVDDTFIGTGAAEKIAGLDGDDSIRGGAGEDALFGGDGNDTLRGQDDDDKLEGGADNDVIFGNSGNDRIAGDEGNDLLFGNIGMDTITGGIGNDQISGNEDDDDLSGGVGNDSMFGGDGADTMNGEDGEDLMEGNDGNDLMSGGADNDRLFGGRDDDTLNGGAGDDELNGQQGNDQIDGGSGNDRIFGIGGNDGVFGGAGTDNIFGGSGNDVLFGDGDNDQLFGEGGEDTLRGGTGDDKLFGGTEDDQLQGEDGDDELFGDGGNDFLFAGEGDDTVFGGAGNDTLDGGFGPGIDRLTGGGGADTFQYRDGDERAVITDFDFSEGDAVDLFSINPANFGLWTITTVGGGSAALVDFDGDADGINEIRFDGYVAGDVLAGWFV